ncbi:sensor domain-containing diguanylate cyclase [Nakamurella deserti]|uniref:GGDEF domain-containing protein n=1 Tax=Nakamurella deserti TaxID=2164074 RepID=UPI000DBE7B34|nr:GGDEF domain-containing protein [Nakamurella deserti]
MEGSDARGPGGPPPSRSGWLTSQSRPSRIYFLVMMAVGVVALAAAAFQPGWSGTETPWLSVAGWTVLAALTSFSIGLQLRKLADGSGTVTMRDVWTLSALFIWNLPAALVVNLALVLWSEAVTKTRVEDRPFVPARAGFNAAFTTVALVAAWGVVAVDGGPDAATWKTWLLAGIVFEAVTVIAVELHVALNRAPRRLSQALIVLGAMCLTEVPLAIVLTVSWAADPVLTVFLAFPMFVAAAGLQYILEFIELRDLVSTDSRTGLLTPAAWRDATEKLVRTQKVAILMADLDGFKALNDTYGHLAGDEILRQVGDILISSIRPLDLACRWGGEEFVLVLANTSVRDAVLVADRIRARVADEARHNGARVTISIGVAGCPPTGSQQLAQALTATMGLADEALYRAKGEGRNRVAAIGAEAR